MADPAVQAAEEALNRYLGGEVPWRLSLSSMAEVATAAVTPLIRRQAFTEAAAAIEADPELMVRSCPCSFRAAALVLGLSEGTDHQWQSGEKRPDGLRTWTCQTCGGKSVACPPPKGPCSRRLGAATIDQ